MKATMKLTALVLLSNASLAFAAEGQSGELGLGTFIFLGFFAVILVFQAIPGIILLYSMLKGLFSPLALEAASTENRTEKTR
jgi:hypothetical protein